MSVTPAVRAVDADKLIDGAITALRANPTIASILGLTGAPNDPNLKRIANEIVSEGTGLPYIVLALASTVYESPYLEAVINTLIDVSCYTQGDSTTKVRQLITACITSLIDMPWTATGFTIWSANMEESATGIRAVSSVEPGGVVVRGRQCTIRVRAVKT